MERPPASLSGRTRRAWKRVTPDHRLAARAAVALFLALFLPWYQETGIARTGARVHTATASLSAWAAFSWTEAAVLLVALAVPAFLFVRAEGWGVEIPGLDGGLVTAAGGWACLFVVVGILDAPSAGGHGAVLTTAGIDWGIFVALALAATVVYAGLRLVAAERPAAEAAAERAEAGPRRPVTNGRPGQAHTAAAAARPAPRRRRAPWAEPVTWDEPAVLPEPPGRIVRRQA